MQTTFSLTILLILVSICILFLISFLDSRPNLQTKKKVLFLIVASLLILIFITRMPIYLFDGLEYEDSYIYKSTARFIYSNFHKPIDVPNPFLTNTCSFGSIKNCVSISTYSGHLIGFPSLIALLHILFGYSPYTANLLSFSFSIFALIPLILTFRKDISNSYYPLIPAVIFLFLPVANVYSITSLSEVTSSFFIISTIYVYICANDKHIDDNIPIYFKIFYWLAYFLILFSALLIKRENAILLFSLPIYPLLTLLRFSNINSNKNIFSAIIVTIIFHSILVIFYIFILNIFDTVNVENFEISAQSFSISHFFKLFPIFFNALTSFRFFSISFVLIVLSLIFIKKSNIYLTLLLTFTMYFFVYSFHHRSLYFIETGEVFLSDTFRYLTNISPLIALLSSYGFVFLFKLCSSSKILSYKPLQIVFIIFLLLTNILCSFSLRKQLISQEFLRRKHPVFSSIDYIKNRSSLLITFNSLLFHIYADNTFFTISPTDIKYDELKNNLISISRNGTKLFYLEFEDEINATDAKRYSYFYEFLNQFDLNLRIDSNQFKLYELEL